MNTPLPLSRRDVIASRLARGQPVLAAELAAEFEVSEDAIRRDLRALAAEGKCRRVYGGALPMAMITHSNSVRAVERPDSRRLLAWAAVDLIQHGEFVFLDRGGVNREVADLLPQGAGISVATNSPTIAAALAERTDIPLIMIGGKVSMETGACIDAEAVASVEKMNIDRCFIGSCGVSPPRLGVIDHADALFKRSLLSRSSNRHAVITPDSFRQHTSHLIAGPSEIELVIAASSLDEDQVASLRAAGFRLLRESGYKDGK